MAEIRFGEIRYDSRRSVFEARVDIVRGSATFRYPCVIHGPEDMGRDLVCASLARAALAMSDSRDPGAITH